MHRLNYTPFEDNLANMIEALDMFVGAQGAVATAHMPWLACPTISKARAPSFPMIKHSAATSATRPATNDEAEDGGAKPVYLVCEVSLVALVE